MLHLYLWYRCIYIYCAVYTTVCFLSSWPSVLRAKTMCRWPQYIFARSRSLVDARLTRDRCNKHFFSVFLFRWFFFFYSQCSRVAFYFVYEILFGLRIFYFILFAFFFYFYLKIHFWQSILGGIDWISCWMKKMVTYIYKNIM